MHWWIHFRDPCCMLTCHCLTLAVVYPRKTIRTVAADYAALVTAGLVLLATFAQFARQTDQPSKPEPPSNYKPYLTVYRGGIMLLTCIAILAVDFPIFPRRFAKVETFGTSLMDVGVGSVVFSSGIVAARSYVNQNAPAGIYALLGSIRSALPILVLGFLRLALTKGVDYQEHHSEYGLHWNFFFTLGFLPPFVTLASFLYKLFPFSVLGGIIAAGYQFVLSQGLQAWIASAPRLDLISANKEGISSFSGYLAIFLLGLDSGTIVFSRSLGSSRLSRWLGLTKTTPVKQIAIQLTLRAAMLWLAFQIWIGITGHQEDLYVSRQMVRQRTSEKAI
ncbi:hypothetical protein BCR43DRAFT_535734 [Syncephalastrum racemosum]|uniref:GPI-anchored wall transfer protein 1 n=1 Tax=Syncephalastrum racemosum TaxID=13706 RepID=A0A1X2HV49_SYNRA|nr:hypothetical protein BCR43DRAFT_535734 [Syncephalastrum racemosum]